VSQGDYVNQGSVLFDIANLSRIWVLFDAYEVDLPFLKVGSQLTYTLQAMPGETFTGKIAFIDATLDPTTRTAKVRVETPNTGMHLKPEMYASATIEAPLKQYTDQIVIPKTAVLWTGKRSLVYKKQPHTETPAFLMHEVELGPSLGDAYVIMSGINDGDEIVTNGAFTVDASAQLEGKLSMMNQDMGSSGSESNEHEGHNMQLDMTNTKDQEHAMINVQGSCEMCKERIEKTAKGIDGVSSANWDLETKVLHINFDPAKTSSDAISKAIATVGHDTDKYKADLDVYVALPGCCKYRD
jgi:Cu(I)/Ag(I) efflux system membrane fusion protein